MVWTINYNDITRKQLRKMNKSVAKKIMDYMDKKISPLNNPRDMGKSLSFDRSGLWRYRVGDYRIICRIQDEDITILVLEVGHRKEIHE
ncbi:MAG: type II toxin-antitoxin system RelE/ParE family toxin [Legionella sp.]|uniref:type II toxin-antitoxin system RelE family toxin n=1 Tax=Legionella sp. TaxID=459 RepID=UPI0039E44374